MSDTSLSAEYSKMSSAHGWNLEVVREMNSKALAAAFC
jgi:hypothetical protein